MSDYTEKARQLNADNTYVVALIYQTLTDEQRTILLEDEKVKAFFERYMVQQ